MKGAAGRPVYTRPPLQFGSRSAQTAEGRNLEPLRVNEAGRYMDGAAESFEELLREHGLDLSPGDSGYDTWYTLFRQGWRRQYLHSLRLAAQARKAS